MWTCCLYFQFQNRLWTIVYTSTSSISTPPLPPPSRWWIKECKIPSSHGADCLCMKIKVHSKKLSIVICQLSLVHSYDMFQSLFHTLTSLVKTLVDTSTPLALCVGIRLMIRWHLSWPRWNHCARSMSSCMNKSRTL